jgi:calpain-15
LRNPWGAFEWQGDWGDESDLWTPQIMEALKYEPSPDDGTFWMNFKDFSDNFKALNVCKVYEYQEVRIKGEFTNQLCNDLDTQIRSKFYYELKVEAK